MQNQNNKNITEELNQLINLLDAKRSDDYQQWVTVGITIKQCGGQYELFETFSKKSKKFDKKECLNKWNSFNGNYNNITIGTLKYYARCDNEKGYDELYKLDERIMTAEQFYRRYGNNILLNENESDNELTPYQKYLNDIYTVEVSLFRPFEVNQRYILQENGPHTKEIANIIKNVMTNDNEKMLSIISAYGTGKSQTMLHIIKEFDPKRILFITYRQTLSYNFYGTFQDFNVGLYLNSGEIKNDRVICQLDSLHKLLTPNMLNGKSIVPYYDLVIFDESESTLSHVDSDTLGNKHKAYKIMEAILKKAKKVIALDGDFGNRSYSFLKSVNQDKDFTVIKNKCVPTSKHWMFTNDKSNFDQKILDDIQKGWKLFICCMACESATNYKKMLESKCKVLVICSKSNDKIKEELTNVNEFWGNYDVVIITPSVEAGVDFSIKHFDKMYVVLSANSTSQRGLNQMTSRVRQLTFLDVNVHLNGMPYKELANFYQMEDIDMMYRNQVLKGDLNLDTDETTKDDPFVTVNKYNELETKNKNPAYFVAFLIKLLGSKGQTYEFDNSKPIKRTKTQSLLQENILKAVDYNKKEIQTLMRKQAKNEASENEKYAIEKYFYKTNWEVENLDEVLLKTIYRKTHIMYNNKAINNQPLKSFMTVDDSYLDIDLKKKTRQLFIVNQLLQLLKFKDKDNEFTKITLELDEFNKLKTKVMKKSELFTDPSALTLFNMAKGKIITNKAFLGFCNSILKNYGIKINSHSYGKGMKKVQYKIKQDPMFKEVNELLTANEFYKRYGDSFVYDETNENEDFDQPTEYQNYLHSKKMFVYNL